MAVEQQQKLDHRTVAEEEKQLERASRLHWFHWLVVACSLLLTVGVWQYAKNQAENTVRNRFLQEAKQVVELVEERLKNYEDALWGGVATIHSHGGALSITQWSVFSSALEIEDKYPGINGIGVIHSVERQQFASYLAEQRSARPNYQVHPKHSNDLLLPISYITPLAANAKAVGLDVAHEKNRLTAALKARDTGMANITGPIVLVQDAEKTPGFLFYAPFYSQRNGQEQSIQQRQADFVGMVYAPFVVKKLMEGTLERTRRRVNFSISDEGTALYSEIDEGQADFDSEPLFTSQISLPLYGRTWDFELWSTKAFRTAQSKQPMFILIGGICIDIMLLMLFVALTRANRRAVQFARRASESYSLQSHDLLQSVKKLEASNAELEQFAYVASHDLQEPLRTLSNSVDLLEKELTADPNPRIATPLRFITDASERMRNLVTGLMDYNRIAKSSQVSNVDLNHVIAEVRQDLAASLEASNAILKCQSLPAVNGHQTELRALFQNLISNAVKFHHPERQPEIHISCEATADHFVFRVKDNGIGIPTEYAGQVFQIFKRLHNQDKYPGSGIGLANCKKVVALHDGDIWVEQSNQPGCTICFTLAIQ